MGDYEGYILLQAVTNAGGTAAVRQSDWSTEREGDEMMPPTLCPLQHTQCSAECKDMSSQLHQSSSACVHKHTKSISVPTLGHGCDAAATRGYMVRHHHLHQVVVMDKRCQMHSSGAM